MSGQHSSWIAALAAAATMISLGMRTRMLARPEFKTRCSACRKLVWRGRTCSCTRSGRG